MKINIIHTKCK